MIMEYQKKLKLLEKTSNQPSKCRTKNCIEINYQSRGVHNNNSDIIFKTKMLKSIKCDYSDAYILA